MSAKDLPAEAMERAIETVGAASRQLPDHVGLWMYQWFHYRVLIPMEKRGPPAFTCQPYTMDISEIRKPFGANPRPRSPSGFLKQLNPTRINKIQQDAHK